MKKGENKETIINKKNFKIGKLYSKKINKYYIKILIYVVKK